MLTLTSACDWLAVKNAPARIVKTIRNSFLIFFVRIDAASLSLFKF
jgi:hypothetical protein